MGLSMSHDAWQSAYSTYSRWRNELAKVLGMTLVPYPDDVGVSSLDIAEIDWDAYPDKNYYGDWDKGTEPKDPLWHLIIHSDCEGKIKRKYLPGIIFRLEEIVDQMPDEGSSYGIQSYRDRTKQLIAGAKRAYLAGDSLKFH